MKIPLEDKNEFEDYIYDVDGFLIYSSGVSFTGGLFVHEKDEKIKDIDGFEVESIQVKAYCTIEKVRRLLLKRKDEVNELESVYQLRELIYDLVKNYAA